MSIKTTLGACLTILAISFQAQAEVITQIARVTDPQDLKYILQTHPNLLTGPLAASLVSGKMDKIVALNITQRRETPQSACSNSITVESEQDGWFLGESNTMCIPDSVFQKQ